MAYVKTVWDETTTPLSTANLDNMETQYDEALVSFKAERQNTESALRCEVVASFPEHSAGRIIYHSTNNRFYFSDGTAWQLMALPGDAGV